MEKKYLIAKAAGISAQLPGSYSTENRLSAITWGVCSLWRSQVTGSGPSEKVISWGVALKSSEVWRGFPLSAREQIMFFFLQNHESLWSRQPSMQEQRPGWMSVGWSISRYQGIPCFTLCVSGTIWGRSLSDPLTTQRDCRKFLLSFMVFSQMFYLTLLRWTVALTDYICKTIHTVVAARQLESQVVSGDIYVTFFY